ncbi:MAG: transglycosylase SLT domain-containing protein [Deferrisomatales bacterium]|nr:transglycosylase SLT domain-containing protein [Deferrisomatales bacterium]
MQQKPRRILRLLFLALPVLWCAGCVGPTTPLGAVDHPARGYHPATPASAQQPSVLPKLRSSARQPPSHRAAILFSPPTQRVHGPYTWQVVVLDPSGRAPADLSRVRLFYNDLEVTQSATAQFQVQQQHITHAGQPALQLEMPHLRLDPMAEHHIRVEYTTTTGEPLTARYAFPILDSLDARESLATTAPFDIDPTLRGIIESASDEFDVNPVVLAALIAQESSFDPLALSRAQALGLTQVTHRTEPDIAREFPGWPRNPKLGRFSRRQLRGLIPAVINRENEWRLDPEKSIRGGAFYLGHLRNRLQTEGNRQYLDNVGMDRGRLVAEASLAAYNSGLNRILYMMKTHGPEWLEQRSTREAKRYVRKILSYYGSFRSAPDAVSATGDAT